MKTFFLSALLLLTPVVYGQNHFQLFYGNLHAHTWYSDGSGTPEDAYKMAKDSGLDFFAVTPHNHSAAENSAKERKDGILIATNHDLYNGTAPLTFTRKYKETGSDVYTTEKIRNAKSVINAAKNATSANFLALYGQEFSTISSSNHINVFNYDSVITVENGNIRGLMELVRASDKHDQIFLQLNHPDYRSDLLICDYDDPRAGKCKNCFNDYGIDSDDFGPSFGNWVKELDPYTHLIEVLSGPAMKKAPIADYHYKETGEDSYYFYLKQGLHISPSVGQDNHYRTWGKMTDARIGIYAASLSMNDLLEAIKANRTFASEDKNFAVDFTINGAFMGSNINLSADDALDIKVNISDADEANAKYTVELIHGHINPEDSRDVHYVDVDNEIIDHRSEVSAGTYQFNGFIASGKPEFYLLRCKQEDDDRCWTAPVWINHPKQTETQKMYYWTASASSKIYHIEGCKTIKAIKAENLRSGSTPPEGRQQHQCVTNDENDEH